MTIVKRGTGVSLGQAFLMEAVLAFILIYVIFAVAFDTIPEKPVKVEAGEEGQSKAVGGRFVNSALVCFYLCRCLYSSPALYSKLTIYTTSGSTKAGFAPIAIGFTLGFLTFLGGTVSGVRPIFLSKNNNNNNNNNNPLEYIRALYFGLALDAHRGEILFFQKSML